MDIFNITFMARALTDCGFDEPSVRRMLAIEFPDDDIDAAIADAQALCRRLDEGIALVAA